MLDHEKARDVRGLIERNCREAGPVVVRGGYRMKKPFHERFWWLPAALTAAAVIVHVCAILSRLTR